jgi:hypothetical protein
MLMPCPRRGLEDTYRALGGARSCSAMDWAGRIGSGCPRGAYARSRPGLLRREPSVLATRRARRVRLAWAAAAAAHPGRRRPTQSDRSQGRCRSIGGAERSFTLGSGARLPRAATEGLGWALNPGNRRADLDALLPCLDT